MSTDNASPLQPRATGFWLTDRDLRARLHMAVEELVTMITHALRDDVKLVDALESFAAEECGNAGLDASYVPLIQAHAAHVIANWTIDQTAIGPLDLQLLFGLDDFVKLPGKVQSALLDQYTADESQWEDFAPSLGPDLYLDRYADLTGG
ncbi:hypothetical protein KV557_00150 [Kitasatospora aureofaciens]|uniref:hypothetical protein n=1 Tax=Kitasatospora aureofaciens TaxID=1894 RepID=UPI001C464F65|nr:hypothetical protein [Kitasatospora aureofaciens]MBV6695537.1 hypothetical protein [Kitasatospora aureofaciens]